VNVTADPAHRDGSLNRRALAVNQVLAPVGALAIGGGHDDGVPLRYAVMVPRPDY